MVYCTLQSSDALLICCLVLRDARRMSDLEWKRVEVVSRAARREPDLARDSI